MATFRTSIAALLLAYGIGELQPLAAAEGGTKTTFEMSISSDDFAYYRASEFVLADIAAGEIASAEKGLVRLRELTQPQPLVLADVQLTVGIAFGEHGHFETGIGHIEEALDGNPDLPAPWIAESRGYLVYFHAALAHLDEAQAQFGLLQEMPPWLAWKLANVYAERGHHGCAIANAEYALAAGRADGRLVSHWMSSHASDVPDHDVLLKKWSEGLRSFRDNAAGDGDAIPSACISL